MKNIAEASKLVGVTPQAIYKAIKNNTVPGIEAFIAKNEKNTTVISDDGINLLKNHFKPVDQSVTNEKSVNLDLIAMLKAELEIKNKQLEAKDKQIEQLMQSLFNAQLLLKNEQERNALLPRQPEKYESASDHQTESEAPKGFFSRLFNSK